MNLLELFILAVGLSLDAFAVAACIGLTTKKTALKEPLIVGLYFGVFQAVMPLIGFLIARLFADQIIAFDHWIAFVLLCILGGRMIFGGLKKEGCPDRECLPEMCPDRACPKGKRPRAVTSALKPAHMLPLALATSIDALAVGVSFAFLQVSIVPAVALIGVTTFVLSAIGVRIGSLFGTKLKSKAEIIGGCILILIGLKILLKHLGILSF
ncbi:MAG: manganese efflux pump MntP family protein [Coriobacteriia bacterium]|nr:manganese efflux pump MntP family protein [Coriobacteriia bacterium]